MCSERALHRGRSSSSSVIMCSEVGGSRRRSSSSSSNCPGSLVDQTSLVVSLHYPFQLIEERYKNIIPEPVQKSIIYHSFPKQEADVLVYASSEFNAERYGVDQVVQIGFHLSGVVFEVTTTNANTSSSSASSSTTASATGVSSSRRGSRRSRSAEDAVVHPEPPEIPENGTVFKVALTFDRGKITSVSCNCENEHSLIFWCDHVITLALHRIRKCVQGVDFVLRVPISETLLQLNRSQLQKLVQYLISDHTEVLPTAQRLADEILFMKTDDNFINRIHGAPDPTAGPSPSDPHSWALNESQIQAQVRAYVSTSPTTSPSSSSSSSTTTSTLNVLSTGSSSSSSTSSSSSSNVVQILIDKVYKMLLSSDSNAERILQIITNEMVRHATKSPSARHHSAMWDHITRVWNVIVLRPNLSQADKSKFEATLATLAHNDNLPETEETEPEDIIIADDQPSTSKRPRVQYKSIFYVPLKLLRRTANMNDYEVMRLHSLVCHGKADVSVIALRILDNLRDPEATIQVENSHVLFDILKRSNPREAFEVALISLSQSVILKQNPYVHEKHLKLVEKLIAKIIALNLAVHGDVLLRYAEKLYGECATTLTTTSSSSFSLISFATYLFNALKGNGLGYKLALKFLQINSDSYVHSHLEAQQIALATSLLTSAKHEIQKLDEISSTIIRVVKSNTNLFRLAQEVFKHASHENLVSVAFNVALHVVKATKYTVHRRRWEMVRWVVSCGVEIGVSKLFYLVRNWGEYFSPVEAVGTVASNILGWVVGGTSSSSSSSSLGCGGSTGSSGSGGPSKIIAAAAAAAANAAPPSGSNVDKRIMDELANAARNLAIQCAKNDPQNCALNTLTLCENDPMAFETSYQIVLESASKEFLTPQQIFTIARYMEHRGYTQRAYRLAVIAVQHVHIGYNQDTHSLISEIHWTCNLSHQLSTPLPCASSANSSSGTGASSSSTTSSSSSSSSHTCTYSSIPPPPSSSSLSHHHVIHTHVPPPCKASSTLTPPTSEIETLIPLLIRNIKCATVLTEILRRSITIMSSYESAYQKTDHQRGGGSSSSGSSSSSNSSASKKLKQRVYEKLSLLIEGTIDSYITTTHSRLVHISPRHYSDFIEFLTKARENFLLAPNGAERFKHLVESMKCTYKGKKKLLFLLTERFG